MNLPVAYKNTGGNSGVVNYRLGDDYIEVGFRKSGVYKYTNTSTGKADIDRMKELASIGKGLGSFIKSHIKSRFECNRPSW